MRKFDDKFRVYADFNGQIRYCKFSANDSDLNAKFNETAGKFDAGAGGYNPHLDDANGAKFNVERASESNLTSGELEGNFAEIFVQAGVDIVIDGVPGYEYKENLQKTDLGAKRVCEKRKGDLRNINLGFK